MKGKFLKLIALGLSSISFCFAEVPTLAITFGTDVSTYGMTSSQESKIQSAERKIREVIGSYAFKTAILNHTFNGRRQFNNNNGLSNSQIYAKILNAAEKLLPSRDNAMDLKIKTYYENSNTVGWTSTGSLYINMNRKFLNNYTSTEVTQNMMHEWLHKMGFSHSVNYSSSRDYSVPYAVGKIMRTLAARY